MKTLREKWNKAVYEMDGEDKTYAEIYNMMADWWFNERDIEIKQLISDIEELKAHAFVTHENKGYLIAISDIKTLLEQRLKS
jgi:hypothetical protein